jgi:hypothetical protein
MPESYPCAQVVDNLSSNIAQTRCHHALEVSPVFLDPQYWEALQNAETLETYAANWLGLLCATISGAKCGVVVLRRGPRDSYEPLAVWPIGHQAESALMQAAESSLQANQGLYRKGSHDSGYLAYPVRDSEGLRGVVAVQLQAAEPSLPAMRLLQWGLTGLQVALQRLAPVPAPGEGLRPLLDYVVSMLEQPSFEGACNALVTQLAMTLDCRRVTLGFREHERRHRLQALSHNVSFSEKTLLVRTLESVMDETADLGRCVHFSFAQDTSGRLYPAHGQLAGKHGGHVIFSVPFGDDRNIQGVVVLEATQNFDANARHLAEAAVRLGGSLLLLKRDSAQGVVARARRQLKDIPRNTLGPGHLHWTLGWLTLVVAVGFGLLTEGRFRVSADAYLEAAIQQAIVAPMDGFIYETLHRAGDVVDAETLLFRLDDADLQLERAKLEHQLNQYREKYRHALAQRERSEINVLKAQLEQVEAELALNTRQLARTQGRAPFDGMIVAGDLSQKQGAPVKRGEILFEIAPLHGYQVILQVDERDISEILVGQGGELVLASASNMNLGFTVTQISPVAETREGKNLFRVEADLNQSDLNLLQPGMKGVGKISVGQRRLVWIWSREFMNWIRLWLWSWWP